MKEKEIRMANEKLHRGDWSQLPSDLLEEICSHLTEFPDGIRFSSVCVQWRSIKTTLITKDFPQNFPWILIGFNNTNPPNHNEDGRVRFLSLSEKRIYSTPLPEFRNHRICAPSSLSSRGWLVAVSHKTTEPNAVEFSISLVNPFTRSSIPLPPLPLAGESFSCLRGNYTSMTVSGSTSLVIVSLLYNTHVYFHGETSWREIDSAIDYSVDFLVHNRYLFLLYSWCYDAEAYDMDNFDNVLNIPAATNMIYRPMHEDFDFECLVESPSGQLLLVVGDDAVSAKHDSFELYRLVDDDDGRDKEKLKWEKVNNIGDHTLFLANGHAICVDSSDFKGCRGNCIYFKGLRSSEPEVRLFDIGQGQVKRVPSFVYPPWFYFRSTVWFVPRLC